MNRIKTIALAIMPVMTTTTIFFTTSCGGDEVKVTGITVNFDDAILGYGQTMTCFATVTPANASNKNVYWSVDDTSLATITQSGVLTAKSSTGTITISAKAKDGSEVLGTKTVNISDLSEPYEYIHDRSFSLMAKAELKQRSGYYSLAWGTCWILSDATPTTYDDYKYYIATNWHVIKGHDVLYDTQVYKTPTISFSDQTSGGIQPFSGYTQFTSFERENDSNFYFDDEAPEGYEHTGIDLFVAKADFSNATGSTKTKLNKLNALQQSESYITKLAPATTDVTQYMCDTMYTAGYPVKNYGGNDNRATWEKHAIVKSHADMYYSTKNVRAHSADEEYDLVDISPQYSFNNSVTPTWMDGGASGSMLIGKIDGDYKVIGIYWGGGVDDAYNPTQFWPSYSIFNSSYGDFLSKYL